MSETHPALLPTGLKDLLPPDAEEEARITNLLMGQFKKFGYARVKPPMVEFEESLLAPGPGATLSRDTFRLMDPVSHHMMGVRADTTAQITRIAGSRLKTAPRPLRLSYAADVLRVNGTQLRPERQFCQVGCELIGAQNPIDDVEAALIAVQSLYHIGIQDVSLDLTVPGLMEILFTAHKVSDIERQTLEVLIRKRDRDGLVTQKTNIADCLVALLDCSGMADAAIKSLKKIKLPKEAKKPLQDLTKVYDGILQALAAYDLSDVRLTIDLIEWRGLDYLNGVSFTLYSPTVRGELGRGGRYRVSEDRSEDATGFTLYMDSVRAAVTPPKEDDNKNVAGDNPWQEMKALQEQGYDVSRTADKK